ncbi:hypothetical protein HYS30_02790 [Candidatus Peregrinibacteria bacterium]|nr:hypothetical protein [Candidatus Peregrinibacteria bacterium]MBI2523937.1 hypothetical protein [Candidatus Peregrinibacteria bacterium]
MPPDTTNADLPDDTEYPIEKPDLERGWSVMVDLEPCPDGWDIGDYCQAMRKRVEGFLYDLGHVEWHPLSLQPRIECTTSSLRRLFRRNLWKKLGITDVRIEETQAAEEVGGEG